MTRVSQAVVVVATLTVGCGLPQAVAVDTAEAETEAIARWVEELGGPQFARREAASKALLEAGQPALGPLAAAIRGRDFEVASRATEIVRDMLAADDTVLAAEA